MSADLSRLCIDCQASFVIEAGERQFFEGRGLPLPRRCAECRRRRKSSQPGDTRGGAIRQSGFEGASAPGPSPTRRRSREHGDAGVAEALEARRSKPRPRWEITCQECGRADTVPFEPKPGLPIFCRDCHRAKRAAAAKEGSGGASLAADRDLPGDAGFPSDAGVDYSPRPPSGSDDSPEPEKPSSVSP